MLGENNLELYEILLGEGNTLLRGVVNILNVCQSIAHIPNQRRHQIKQEEFQKIEISGYVSDFIM
jgi:hypothetical protein